MRLNFFGLGSNIEHKLNPELNYNWDIVVSGLKWATQHYDQREYAFSLAYLRMVRTAFIMIPQGFIPVAVKHEKERHDSLYKLSCEKLGKKEDDIKAHMFFPNNYNTIDKVIL